MCSKLDNADFLTKVKPPEVRPLLQVRHSPKDPHCRVVQDGSVVVSRGRAVHGAALRDEVPRLRL